MVFCSIIKWSLIACFLPIWYIGAVRNNYFRGEDENALNCLFGFLSIFWVIIVIGLLTN